MTEPISGVTDLPFDRAEYADRLLRVRSAMDAAGIDLLVVTDPANMYWVTGYDAWSFYSHQAVVVFGDAEPIWWGRDLDVAGARLTTWLADDRAIGYPESLVQSPPDHPHDHLATVIAASGHTAARIGVEFDAPYLTAAAAAALARGLPDTDLVDATGLVNRARAVKSAAELEYMRLAASISARAHDAIAAMIEPGLPRHRLAAEIARVTIEGVDGRSGDQPAIVPLMPSGSEGAAPHLTWDARPFVADETTFVELSGCVRRYHAPMSRSYHLGEPDGRLRAAERAVATAFEAGIEAMRPGAPASAVAAAVFGVLTEHGFERGGRCGYPVGAGYPPDWGERTLSLRSGDETSLEPGMTFHLMPVLWTTEFAVGITETVVVADSGPAIGLVDQPRRLVSA